MPMPSCFAVLNAGYFESILGQIHAVTTAAELQALVNEVYGTLSLLVSTIDSQLTLLGPLEALLVAPTDLASVITWITNMIVYLENQVAPLAKYAAMVTALTAEVATMTAAIEAVAAAKFPGISITIPPVAAFCTL